MPRSAIASSVAILVAATLPLGSCGARTDLLFEQPPEASWPFEAGYEGAACGSATDPHNCGTCGHDCQGGTCAGGLCSPIDLALTLQNPLRLALDATYVYVTDRSISSAVEDGWVLRLPKMGGAPVVLAGNEPWAFAIAVHADSLYWTRMGTPAANFADGCVRRMLFDGSSPVTLEANAKLPDAIALDAVSAYWVESGVAPGFSLGSVRSMPLDGGAPITLADAGVGWSPGNLAIDDSYVYWTADTPGPAGLVARVPLAGGKMETLIATTQIPTSIVLDAQNIYWVEWSEQHTSAVIMSASHSGTNPRMLWSGQGMIPLDLAVDSTALYWTERMDGGGPGQVMKLPLAGGSAVTLAADDDPFGIAVDDTGVYWTRWSSPNAPGTGSVRKVAK